MLNPKPNRLCWTKTQWVVLAQNPLSCIDPEPSMLSDPAGCSLSPYLCLSVSVSISPTDERGGTTPSSAWHHAANKPCTRSRSVSTISSMWFRVDRVAFFRPWGFIHCSPLGFPMAVLRLDNCSFISINNNNKRSACPASGIDWLKAPIHDLTQDYVPKTSASCQFHKKGYKKGCMVAKWQMCWVSTSATRIQVPAHWCKINFDCIV